MKKEWLGEFMMSLQDAIEVAERMKSVAEAINKVTSKRLAALLKERESIPRDGSEESRAYEEGFLHGLTAGVEASRIDFADLRAEDLHACFNWQIDVSDKCSESPSV